MFRAIRGGVRDISSLEAESHEARTVIIGQLSLFPRFPSSSSDGIVGAHRLAWTLDGSGASVVIEDSWKRSWAWKEQPLERHTYHRIDHFARRSSTCRGQSRVSSDQISTSPSKSHRRGEPGTTAWDSNCFNKLCICQQRLGTAFSLSSPSAMPITIT